MSVTLKTLSHGEVNSGFIDKDIVRVGEYEIPTEEFVWFAAHILRGGIFGWDKVPPYVASAVKKIDEKLRT